MTEPVGVPGRKVYKAACFGIYTTDVVIPTSIVDCWRCGTDNVGYVSIVLGYVPTCGNCGYTGPVFEQLRDALCWWDESITERYGEGKSMNDKQKTLDALDTLGAHRWVIDPENYRTVSTDTIAMIKCFIESVPTDISNLKKQLAEKAARIDELGEKLKNMGESYDEHNDNYEKRINRYHDDINDRDAQIEELGKKLKAAEESKTQRWNTVVALSDENTDLKKQVAEKAARIDELRGKIDAIHEPLRAPAKYRTVMTRSMGPQVSFGEFAKNGFLRCHNDGVHGSLLQRDWCDYLDRTHHSENWKPRWETEYSEVSE